MMKTGALTVVVTALVLATAGRATAQPVPEGAMPPPTAATPRPQAAPEELVSKHLGVGYKIGNGLGFVGGDIVITPIDHLTLDLQANWFNVSGGSTSASGYGLAPGVQFHVNPAWSSGAYVAVGYLYATISLSNVTSSAQGAFLNAGYEWRWENGFGVLVGGGISRLGTVHASDGVTTVEREGGFFPNLEVGVRYMFL
jgi:hypothetical protein